VRRPGRWPQWSTTASHYQAQEAAVMYQLSQLAHAQDKDPLTQAEAGQLAAGS
jgi:hypothetical protein